MIDDINAYKLVYICSFVPYQLCCLTIYDMLNYHILLPDKDYQIRTPSNVLANILRLGIVDEGYFTFSCASFILHLNKKSYVVVSNSYKI